MLKKLGITSAQTQKVLNIANTSKPKKPYINFVHFQRI